VLILPDANTAGMQVFLDAFAATIAKDEHVALVVDGAGWHASRTLQVPSNITLVALPPYCPELNPVERVWLYLKERFLSLRLHNDYDDIVAAASKAWTFGPLASCPERSTSATAAMESASMEGRAKGRNGFMITCRANNHFSSKLSTMCVCAARSRLAAL